MSEAIRTTQERAVSDLAGDCRIDVEDAQQIAEATRASPLGAARKRLVELMRSCASKTDGDAFAILKAALGPELAAEPNRVLLRPGARGPQVAKLRRALGTAAGILGDRRLDPGGSPKFDSACQVALRSFQKRMGGPVNGVLDSLTLKTINFVLNESSEPLLDLDRAHLPAIGVRLEFFPGDEQRKLVVRSLGKVVDVYDMRAGPAKRRPDNRPGVLPRFSFAPTPRGAYELGKSRAHVTRSWKHSQIPFGARLRLCAGEVQFKTDSQLVWQTATGPQSILEQNDPHRTLEVEDFLVAGRLPERYQQNDFGHRATYLRHKGRTVGHMIHATPMGEHRYGDDSYRLLVSHGCEHMRPHDLDEATAKGYLREGTPFVVRGYGEQLPADVVAFIKSP